MRIVAISDLHGLRPAVLPSGDVLVVAGDCGSPGDLAPWVARMSKRYKAVIGIAGNHDFLAHNDPESFRALPWHYLQDESVTIDGVHFFGSPWSLPFRNWTFMAHEAKLERLYKEIPEETNVLITHGPPYGFGDRVVRPEGRDAHQGSKALRQRIGQLPNLELVLFGHIHEGYGTGRISKQLRWANCSVLNERYQPTNAPIVFNLTSRPVSAART